METNKVLILIALLAMPFIGIAQTGQQAHGSVTFHQRVNGNYANATAMEAVKLKIKEFNQHTGKIVVTAQQMTNLENIGKIASPADRQRYFVISDHDQAVLELDAELQRLGH